MKELFGVLKHYGYLGAVCSDSNQELVTIAFKVSIEKGKSIALTVFFAGNDSVIARFCVLFSLQ